MRKVLFTFLPTTLIVLLLSFFLTTKVNATGENPLTGSITVCTALSDQNGNIIDGSQTPGATFTISGFVPNPTPLDGGPAGALPTSSFTTPLTLNTKIFQESKGNDSQCVTYGNLSLGAYYYAQETIPSSNWLTPLYNDQFTSIVSKVSDVFTYDGSLFNPDQSHVATRNENADGSIVLNAAKPNRTLIVVNKLAQSSNNNNSSSTSSQSGGSNNSSAPSCNDVAPSSAPAITSVTSSNNSVTLTWTPAQTPVSYYLIAYGTQPGNYTFGNPNVGNVTTYTISGLSGGQTYYFAVRAVNGCKPGPYSNEVSNSVSGDQIAGPAVGFHTGILGATTVSSKKGVIDLTKSICAACFWWPVLLGEIIALVGLYLLLKRKSLPLNKYLLGTIVGLLAYLIFLLLNKGHLCPQGGIGFWKWSIPCQYFWILDGIMVLLFSYLIRGVTPLVQKKQQKENK